MRNGARLILAACEIDPKKKSEFLFSAWDTIQWIAGLYVPPEYDAAYRAAGGDT